MTESNKLDFAKVVEQEAERLRVLHPTPDDIPGCVTLFDEYLACNVIRTQVKNIYRYGERTKCDEKFGEFKYCLTTKMMHPEERREAWIRRRAEWWANRRLGQSSENVWDIRETPLPNFPRPITSEMLQDQPSGGQLS
ncbi:hypothetical protein CPB83DRAFT_812229 [Crepidotus variabilis]|uniref:Uncharacterized protein n=1 Tax=Crepidotus variabilis TaxID=179855 RepID=A0A9P6EHW3_9AGAR|nr:hypothetical protein CPB83DRAFT_812229 [Crepidotus variabilis]